MSMVYNTYDFQVAHPDIIKQLAVQDMLFAYYQCPQAEKQVNLYVHYNVIIFTIKGTKTFHHRDKSWTLTDNDCVFFRKAAYTQERDDLVGWQVLAFYFGNDFLQKLFREYRQYLPLKNLPPPPADMLLNIQLNETAIAFFYSMVPYFTQKIPPAESLLELKFKELLFHVLSNPANIELLAYINSMEDDNRTSVREIMEANYTYNLSIDQFARMCGRSVSSFKREFQQLYQTSPGKWLIQRRLEYAKHLFETSKKNINEVADESGFENLAHFSRAFKTKYNFSPLHYRKSANNSVAH